MKKEKEDETLDKIFFTKDMISKCLPEEISVETSIKECPFPVYVQGDLNYVFIMGDKKVKLKISKETFMKLVEVASKIIDILD